MKKIFRMAAFMLALGSMTAGFTSCGEDDGTEDGSNVNNNIEEQINFDGLNVKAQTNGQVLIDGKVTANTKIKSLVLSTDEEGKNVIVDLLASGDQTKAKEINEAGEKQKTFTLDIPTAAVDVQTMYLVGKTRGDKKASSQITETLSYTIGASKSDAGSYLSIINKKQMTMDAAKSEAAEVIAESSADGYSVTGLKKASTAKSADIAAKAGKVALYQDGKSVASITEGGVIITESGAICKVVKFNNTASGDATVEGITMKGGLGAIKSVDVSAAAANFSK
jgi:hypothetical protein